MKNIFLGSTFVFFLLFGLNISAQESYVKEITNWHEERIMNLKKENGWLNLAGLFWLKEGENTFGADSRNIILFPEGKSAHFLGKFVLSKSEITLIPDKNSEIYSENQLISSPIKLYPSEKNIILKHQNLRWFIIKRGEKFAVRLRDLESPFLKEFHGIEQFPIDEQWKVKAKFTASEGKKIPILDITGQTSLQQSPGSLAFELNGKSFTLDALSEGESLFIIFADQTNKQETYGAGRFLYASLPDKDGFVELDFNKSFNPPCAFTPYATCPLPPKQNYLSIRVTAGEKNYGGH